MRTRLLIGNNSFEKLRQSKIAIFGVGGVGSCAAEALVRAGIGNIDLFDFDVVDITNINRQIMADTSTVGLSKVEVMKNRIKKINPQICVKAYNCFFSANNESQYNFSIYDYIIDAIDTVSSKILLIQKAKKTEVPIISSMGTGNKINPLSFEVSDISKTSVCPLARVMRRELKKKNIKNVKVVYSKENPIYNPCMDNKNLNQEFYDSHKINASISFVPSVAGLILASEVVKDIIKK